MTQTNPIETFVLTNETCTDQTAVQLGQLMQQLDIAFGSEPIAEKYLHTIIDSPYHDQLLARDTQRDKIVGAASLSIVMEPGFAKTGNTAYLGGVVVDGTYRGSAPASIWYSPTTQNASLGVAENIWQEMLQWGQDRNITSIIFESEVHREAAQRFYRRMGAVPLANTIPFRIGIASAHGNAAR